MKVKTAEFIKSATSVRNCPADNLSELAFIGRSNVGKSSLLNMLLGRKNLVKTSKKPGKTVTLNYFLVNDEFYFVDLPGYGFARRAQAEQVEWRSSIEEFLEKRENLKNIFVLIDSRHGMQKNDEMMISFLEHYHLPYTVVYTKVDKLSKSEKGNLKRKAKAFFFASAVTGEGKEELWDFIESFLS